MKDIAASKTCHGIKELLVIEKQAIIQLTLKEFARIVVEMDDSGMVCTVKL